METRSLARRMAAETSERYVARGKKTIEQLSELARKEGEESITVIEERGGKAALAAVIRVDERGRWSWAEERLLNST
jgi:rRNA maturation protein Rpf1